MQVNLQYAEEHLTDLVSAVDAGQEVEISRPDKPSLKLVVSRDYPVSHLDRKGMVGSGKGEIWYADDWDSPEVNDQIARLFNESKLFPDEPE
ncbi:MAG TPA: type II toxin-antitoxin system Phd/YefM family antitoxin [Acidobacteriaceae bacterium]